MSFSENLQFYRKRENVTQEQLAEKLDVSRQTISKWEAGTTYPEMDKILQLCEMFSCSMDVLLRGNAQVSVKEDTANYDEHMNQFGKRITTGIAVLLSGVTVYELGEAFRVNEGILNGIFMLFILVAVIDFVVSGIQHEAYEKRYPYVQPFYDEKTLEAFEKKFPIYIGVGIGLILAGVIIEQVLEYLLSGARAFSGEALAITIFMIFVTSGVVFIVQGGFQKEKYDVDGYNKKNNPDPEEKKHNDLMGAVCGVIMLITTAVYLVFGFVYARWEIAPIVYIVGGILCGIVAIVMNVAKR